MVPPTTQSINLQAELEQIKNDPHYKPFMDLISEKIEPLVGAAAVAPEVRDMAVGALAVIKYLQATRDAHGDVNQELEKITGGFFNKDWNVLGNVNQANRDIVINHVKVIFSEYGGKMHFDEVIKTFTAPVVLVVMTTTQVNALSNRSAFDKCPSVQGQHFKRLEKRLNSLSPGWQQRYASQQQDWRPFDSSPGGLTIAQLVQQGFDIANQIAGFTPPITPEFWDIESIKTDRANLKKFREQGCIIILDIISMCHPQIQCAFLEAMLDASLSTYLLSIAPTASAANLTHELAIVIQQKLAQMEFFKRQIDPYMKQGASMELVNDHPNPVPVLAQWVQTRLSEMKSYHPESTKGVPTTGKTYQG